MVDKIKALEKIERIEIPENLKKIIQKINPDYVEQNPYEN